MFQGVISASLDRFQKNSPLGSLLPAFGGKVTTPSGYLAALWMHECGRVFCDKMITHEDKAWVDGAIRDLSKCGLRFSLLVGRMMHASALQAMPHLVTLGAVCWSGNKEQVCCLRLCADCCLASEVSKGMHCIQTRDYVLPWRHCLSQSPPGRQHFPAGMARQLEEPLYFVDFLRVPVTDPETGEVLDAHPSFYESVAGGLPDIRRCPQQHHIRLKC